MAGKPRRYPFVRGAAATEENIARVNLLRKASDSSILMAIDALDAILSIHLLPLAKI